MTEIVTGKNNTYNAYFFKAKNYKEIKINNAIYILATIYPNENGTDFCRKYFHFEYVESFNKFQLLNDYDGYQARHIYVIPIKKMGSNEIIDDIKKAQIQ